MKVSERLHEIRTGFERPFWVANISELFERLSYYAAFASLARYLHEALDFPTERASALSGLFGGLVWFLAIFGGAIAYAGISTGALSCLLNSGWSVLHTGIDRFAVAGTDTQRRAAGTVCWCILISRPLWESPW